MDSKDFYTYTHSVNGKIVYVGKGHKKRAWSKNRSPLWKRITNNEPEVFIVEDNLTEREAFDLETFIIHLLLKEYLGNCSANVAIRDCYLRHYYERKHLRKLYIPRCDWETEDMQDMWDDETD